MQRRLGYAQWRVSERAGDRLVGIAGLQPLDGGPDVELTYALEPSSWGAGYATEAGAAALEYAFAEAGLDRVVGIAKPENTASVRVLEKLGMRALGAAEYWGKRWAKFEVAAAAWRAEQAAARPPLLTERLELRRFAAADLEPLLAVFGDAAVMRYVGAERRPLDRDERRGSAGGRRGALVGARVRPAGGRRAADRAPGRRGRPAAPGGRPGRRARLHAGARRLGSRLRDRGGAARSCAGASPACGCRRIARRGRPRQPRLAARARASSA